MTDENPLLNEDEQAFEDQLRDAFGTLKDADDDEWGVLPEELRAELTEKLLHQAHVHGAAAGKLYAAIGSNVAMAYFHAGKVYAEGVGKHVHFVPKDQHSAAFYDGFTSSYFVDVTDQQKSGPYA